MEVSHSNFNLVNEVYEKYEIKKSEAKHPVQSKQAQTGEQRQS